ncbi:DNA polymerase III subunit beta [Patescibacteria group bacterium]|nr:DNA polymerase III subunit beta [Patescibacteria group bacterium]MCL5410194.1 DNA polymerase III subunit beta [Patescibacteria group bacterium]
MRFKILQQDLWPSLQSVARSAGVRAQLPVLGNILISTDQDKLKLSATNLEIGVVKTLKAENSEVGEVTVPAKTLVEIVANLSGEQLEFESTADQLKISSPSFSSQINGIAATEFPTIPLSGKAAVKISPQILISSLPQVAFASAADDGRPILTGILTEIKDKKLQLVATDGYRLAHKIVPIAEEENLRVLVPRRTFEEVLRLINEDEADLVEISTSENQNQIIFKFGTTMVSSRLIEGQFPAWERIIPTACKARVITGREDLLKAVKLASIFARNETNIVKLLNSASKLTLNSEAKQLGHQQREVTSQTEGEEIEIAFNTKFLQDALSTTSASQVILELSGNLSAAIIKPMGEEGLEYIIMPVNLS